MPKQSRPPPIRNHLLAALPGEEYRRLLPHLQSVALPSMGVLYEGVETIQHVYFPDDGLIWQLIGMNDETVREIGVIGNEGVLGAAVALGMKTSRTRALVRLPGSAMRMKAGHSETNSGAAASLHAGAGDRPRPGQAGGVRLRVLRCVEGRRPARRPLSEACRSQKKQ